SGSRCTRARTRASYSTPTNSISSPPRRRYRCRPTTPPRWCRSIRWWASFACTMPGSSTPASATRAPAAAGRARCWRCARAKCPSSSSMARSSAGSFTRECWSDPTRSTASASARTTRRRGSSYPSISEPDRAKSRCGAFAKTLAGPLLACAGAGRFFRHPTPACRPAIILAARTAAALGLHAAAQRIHETNHFRGFALFRYLDLFARLFLLQQFFQRLVILKLFGLEMPSLSFNDVRRQIRHVLRNLFIFDVVEIHVLLAHLIWISQRDAEKTLAARFERHDMLTRGEDHAGERHHAFLADRLADDRERLLADFAIRRDVVRAVEIELVDFFLRHEFVDLDRALALDGNRLKLFGLDLDVFALVHFVAFDDVGRVDLVSRLGIHLAVFDTIARLFIDLMEADLFSFAARGEECNRTRYERELQIAFPVRTWGHD